MTTAEGLAESFLDKFTKFRTGGEALKIMKNDFVLSDLSRFEQALRIVFAQKSPSLIVFAGNGLTDEGLSVLSRVIGEFPMLRETLSTLQFWDQPINSLQPLIEAGILEKLDMLLVNECSVSGEFPVQLAQNLPKLQHFFMHNNSASSKFVFPVEALCQLLSQCKIGLLGNHAQPLGIHVRGNDVGEREYKGKVIPSVREILEFLDIDCSLYKQTMIKPARLTKARCGSCASPRPKYACAGCKTTTYCNKECQAKDWQRHQRACAV